MKGSSLGIGLITVLLVVISFLCCGILALVGMYNNLVTMREGVDTQWSQVETQYQRRYDLIPNLTNSTKGYLAHEQQVFKDIADARTKYAGTTSGSSEQLAAQSDLEHALARLLVIIENYPDLKSDKTVQALMDELAGTENRITVARQRYNESARDYNVLVKKFPTNIFANMVGFEEKPLYEAREGADEAPEVDLILDGDKND